MTAKPSRTPTPDRIAERILAPLGVEWHFVLRDYATGETFEGGTAARYPFCSTFKIAVVAAFCERFGASRHHEEIEVTEGDRRAGAGLLGDLTLPLRLRIEQLLELVVGISDGTATDLLIREVGLERVQAFIARHTEASRLTSTFGELMDGVTERVGIVPEEERRNAYRLVLDGWGCRTDYTNARDLVSLLEAAAAVPGARRFLSVAHVWEMLQGGRRAGLAMLGKTGSFGDCVYQHDVQIVERGGKALCAMGLCTRGWAVPKAVVPAVFAQVAYEVTGRFADSGSQKMGDTLGQWRIASKPNLSSSHG